MPRSTPRSQRLWDAARAEHVRQAKEDRQQRRRARWKRWVAFWKRRGGDLQIAVGVAGAITAIAQNQQIRRFGAWVRHFYLDRYIAPAELPKTGQPTTAVDFVPKPSVAPHPKQDPR